MCKTKLFRGICDAEILGEVAAEFADSIIAELSNEELGEGDDY